MNFAELCLPLAAISTALVVRWLVWAGLLAVTGALLVLARTRWGQSQPVSKCIVLSLLAHVLLALYATTVGIITGGGGNGDGGEVSVSIVDGPDEGQSDVGLGEPDGRSLVPGDAGEVEAPKEELPPTELPTPSPAEPAKLPGAPSTTPTPTPPENPRPAEPIDTRPPQRQDAPASDVPPPPDLPLSPDTASDPAATSSLPALPSDASGIRALPVRDDDSTGLVGPLTARAPAAAADAVAGGGSGGVYGNRTAKDRSGVVRRNGGSPDTEAAVEAALKYLVDQQRADGRWSSRTSEGGRDGVVLGERRPGAGSRADTGITGLALLAFLAAGNTHERGQHARTVQHGLEFLLGAQGADGNLAGDATLYEKMYCHAMAGFALSEAYAMSRDDRLKESVQRAVRYSVSAQDRNTGGWRYHPAEAGDTSQLGWQVMFLKSAALAGIPLQETTRRGIERFLGSVSSGAQGGLASYRPGHRASRTMTAEALVCRQFLSLPAGESLVKEAGAYLLEELPGAEQDNVYYWYYATLALFQAQGADWEKWNEAMQQRLLGAQRQAGELAGSWDPDPLWGTYGGRVYSTALSALCLEVYYRYLPLYAEARKK